VRVRDIKDYKILLGNVSFVWDMTLRHWVTGFRCFEAKYCHHLQGNNIRTEYSKILLRNLQNMHKLHFFVNQHSKSGLGRRVEISRSLTIRHTHTHTLTHRLEFSQRMSNYYITCNKHERRTSMLSAGCEPSIPAT